MREIRLTINPDGTTQTDFSGFVGKTCLLEADKLRELLSQFGIQVEETAFTPKPELDIPITTSQAETTRIAQEGTHGTE
jgi:hypothetical protein